MKKIIIGMMFLAVFAPSFAYAAPLTQQQRATIIEEINQLIMQLIANLQSELQNIIPPQTDAPISTPVVSTQTQPVATIPAPCVENPSLTLTKITPDASYPPNTLEFDATYTTGCDLDQNIYRKFDSGLQTVNFTDSGVWYEGSLPNGNPAIEHFTYARGSYISTTTVTATVGSTTKSLVAIP